MSYYRQENQRVRSLCPLKNCHQTYKPPTLWAATGQKCSTGGHGEVQRHGCVFIHKGRQTLGSFTSRPSSYVISAPAGGRKDDEGFRGYQEFHSELSGGSSKKSHTHTHTGRQNSKVAPKIPAPPIYIACTILSP